MSKSVNRADDDAVPVDYKAIAHEAANLAARIPGATFYNAAEFALNIVQERAAPPASTDAVPVAIHQIRASRYVSEWTDVSQTNELFHSYPDDLRRIVYAAPIASALPATTSQRELDARVKLEVKAGLWDLVRTICVAHGAGVDKTVTEWLAERLGAAALPAAQGDAP